MNRTRLFAIILVIFAVWMLFIGGNIFYTSRELTNKSNGWLDWMQENNLIQPSIQPAGPGTIWFDLELFLPTATRDEDFSEFTRLFFWSLTLFWPKDKIKLLIVSNEDTTISPGVFLYC